MEATAKRCLLVEGESELSVFFMLCRSIDRQLGQVEAESRETKLPRVMQSWEQIQDKDLGPLTSCLMSPPQRGEGENYYPGLRMSLPSL